ncbi:unnamed protein product [Cylicostephanus goldi]|uniref:Uncharacterized protein n=1 Tax=Cylicostephanus goldi TaxID=71465 RepID=A0A3P6T576_CYLGO|nr:unnamed protein product [Cylicostephanus goldi]
MSECSLKIWTRLKRKRCTCVQSITSQIYTFSLISSCFYSHISMLLPITFRPIAEAAVKFGTCVKQCFVYNKNSEGFCYDGKGCQPSITQKNLRTSLRICLAQTGWKSHAYDLCECARKAGVE